MVPTRPQTKPFNLMRWFALLSLACIVLTSSVTAIFLSQFLSRNLLERDAILTMELVNTILQTERGEHYFGAADEDYAKRHPEGPTGQSDFVKQILQLENATSFFEGRSHGQANTEIEDFFHHVSEMPDVIRTHVYLRDHTIIWSSDPSAVGTKVKDNRDLERAFAGNLNVVIEVSGETHKEEHAFFPRSGIQFVENYIPIWLDDRRSVWGVIELYRTPQTLFEAIREGNQLVWASAVGGGAFLYLTLFWIVRRANTVIQRQQTQLVENETLAAVGEMASAVAHGLRNPLASIRSSAELALDDESEPSVREPLADIVQQADRLDHWVRDLLTSARPTVGEFDKVDVNDVVSRGADTFATQATKAGIETVLETAAGIPAVNGNAAALTQALNSVIANAVEAMSDGGVLRMRTAPTPDGRAIDLTVTDTGKGMSPGEIRKAFQPFVTTKGAGLGLGLPLAKRIVERHGGQLSISSGKSGGTAVTLRIPVAG